MTAVAAALIASFAWLASEQVDQLALGRQAEIVGYELQERIGLVAREQQSIAVWDDTVTYTRANDTKWMADYIGNWLHSYFGHDLGYVLDDKNRIIFAAREGKSAPLNDLGADQRKIDAFAAQMRRHLIANSWAISDSTQLRGISSTEVAQIGGRPSVISAHSIVPSTKGVKVRPGSEFIQIAVKFIDGRMLPDIGEHSQVEGVKFIAGAGNAPEAAVPVVSAGGVTIGYITWKPIKPGLMLVKKIAPSALLGFAVAVGTMLYLWLGLRKTSLALLRSKMELIKHRAELEETVKLRTQEIERQATELDRMLKQERHVNALQRQFVSMASHEFRTPLAVIDAAAQRLIRQKETPTSAYITQKVDQIRQSVARMVDLMESILSAGRLSDGVNGIQPTDADLAELIAMCCKRQSEIGKTHQFHMEFKDFPASIVADPSALEQVFTNLLSNAIKYAPSAPDIFIRGWAEGGTVYISFRDQGIGMDTDDIPKLFQPYFRARSSTGIAGTGIGLNLVKKIIDLHGGTISVESELGRGTTFTLALPIDASRSISNTSDSLQAA
jgi:signal transduction histidine kinase